MPRSSRLIRAAAAAAACLVFAISATGSVRAYASDTQLDPAFGSSGRVVEPLVGSQRISDMALGSAGKIVLAAWGGLPGSPLLERFTANGRLDRAFGSDGVVENQHQGFAMSCAVQDDGRIVVAGGHGGRFVVERFTKHGAPDTSFSDDGRTTTDAGPVGGFAFDVAVQPNGRTLAVGFHQAGGTDWQIARYKRDGTLDPQFGDQGLVVLDLGTHDDQEATSVVIQPDGKIVVGGWMGDSQEEFALARLNTNGTLDHSFGQSGIVRTDFGHDERIWGLTLAGDDILAVGSTTDGSTYAPALARYLPDGDLDTLFGGDGRVVSWLGDATWFATGVAVDGQGDILVSANFYNGDSRFTLARYRPHGGLDARLGTEGIMHTPFPGNSDETSGIDVQEGGRIIAAGTSELDPHPGHSALLAGFAG